MLPFERFTQVGARLTVDGLANSALSFIFLSPRLRKEVPSDVAERAWRLEVDFVRYRDGHVLLHANFQQQLVEAVSLLVNHQLEVVLEEEVVVALVEVVVLLDEVEQHAMSIKFVHVKSLDQVQDEALRLGVHSDCDSVLELLLHFLVVDFDSRMDMVEQVVDVLVVLDKILDVLQRLFADCRLERKKAVNNSWETMFGMKLFTSAQFTTNRSSSLYLKPVMLVTIRLSVGIDTASLLLLPISLNFC